MKICGHGTILALINNRKPRTTQLIQLTVLGFLVSGLKYCFMKPLHWTRRVFCCGFGTQAFSRIEFAGSGHSHGHGSAYAPHTSQRYT